MAAILRANGKKERLVEAESVVFLQGTKFRDRERDEARLTPGTTLVARVVYQRRVHAKGGGGRKEKRRTHRTPKERVRADALHVPRSGCHSSDTSTTP